MIRLDSNAVRGLANLLLAVRYPFPLYIVWSSGFGNVPLQAALRLALQLQAAKASRVEDVYLEFVYPNYATDALHGDFAAEFLCHNLSEQHLLCSLPVLARADVKSIQDQQRLQDALHAIRNRLGYAFFESAIHACVGHTQVSQEKTITRCVRLVCNSFPDDILPLAQRYGDLMIRLHGAEPFLTMLHQWCEHQADQSRSFVSREALVEAFSTPLTRAAAMILDHPKLSSIPSQEAVEAAFGALSLAERARLLLTSDRSIYNKHASGVESKLRLLGFDPSIQTAAWASSDGENTDSDESLVRYLLHMPDPTSSYTLLMEACKQSEFIRYTLAALTSAKLCSDEARMSLARVLINAPAVLHDVKRRCVRLISDSMINDIQQFARSLPDASLGAALETALEWHEYIYKLSVNCAVNVLELIINRFHARLKRLQYGADVAEVYDAMLQNHRWLETVDATIANILGPHPMMSTMYSILSEPEQGI